MEALGNSNTSELEPAVLEVYATMLGLLENPPGLIDFDEGWRAINDKDFRITGDPRSED